ncbi:MAG: tetratricopeptide repeat protein, partial [Nitrospirota bacterium]
LTGIIRYVLLAAVLAFPSLSTAGPDTVLSANSRSIAVVTAYNRAGEPLTAGSGFVAGEGLIVTNYHVIGIAKSIKVSLGGRNVEVRGVVYGDRENDIVVLKTDAKDMRTVRLAASGSLRPGEKVYVISGSEGPGAAIHEGTFKGTKTVIHGKKALEIKASITYGSSGSAVFNAEGEVVGIVTFSIDRGTPLVWAMPAELIRDGLRANRKIKSVNTIIKEYGSTPEYWFYLGYFLLEAGAPGDAAGVLREAVRMKSGYADAYYYLAAAYEKLNRNKEAEAAYRKAVKTAPDFADAHFRLGVLLGKEGRFSESVTSLKEAVRHAPEFPNAYYSMGIACGKLGRQADSIEAYKKAVLLKPDFEDAYFNLGVAYQKSGAYRESAASFETLVRLRPDSAEGHYNLGLLYLVLKNKSSALESYKVLKGLNRGLAGKLLDLINK